MTDAVNPVSSLHSSLRFVINQTEPLSHQGGVMANAAGGNKWHRLNCYQYFTQIDLVLIYQRRLYCSITLAL